MRSKAELTSLYIIEKVAPVFNKKGYAATSMADISEVTGLSKGAIYGNFENKEAIAIAAFHKNVNDLLKKIAKHQEQSNSPLQKLFLITDFYRTYKDYSTELGGCPILNIGVDANQQNTKLLQQVQLVISKTQNNVAKLVEWGKENGEIKATTESEKFAKHLYTRIQGAVFMSYTMNDNSYLVETANELDTYITTNLKA
ncbi:TetR family transcriptional regulator [Ulvibacter sp. MAR_2010_11]|uniref:TetR/AcrR family transcriptional regulator n=1 Tax=Ulvibacter sp. MAR_2010_11 TaxID=1250229 RepID=UPI000C2C76F0|nr:TetR/AcrR family transcriptional regulator [Ulvibacter sp. MAR_2010_11]PKA84600.1 TetR family transcriptional regulator [Ulvibacter sp. MAR_2010_11]